MGNMTMSVQRKYREDPKFNYLVKFLESMLLDKQCCCKDLLEGTSLACQLYQERLARAKVIYEVPFNRSQIKNGELIIKVNKEILGPINIENTIFDLYDKHYKLINTRNIAYRPVRYIRTEDANSYIYRMPFAQKLSNNIGIFILKTKQ